MGDHWKLTEEKMYSGEIRRVERITKKIPQYLVLGILVGRRGLTLPSKGVKLKDRVIA